MALAARYPASALQHELQSPFSPSIAVTGQLLPESGLCRGENLRCNQNFTGDSLFCDDLITSLSHLSLMQNAPGMRNALTQCTIGIAATGSALSHASTTRTTERQYLMWTELTVDAEGGAFTTTVKGAFDSPGS